ncbi:MAG: hypothetical protein WKF47_14175 [Geodermatophilaceae bacterium]
MLMRRLHGPDWRRLAGAADGRRRRHAAITAALVAALGCAVLRRPPAAARCRRWSVRRESANSLGAVAPRTSHP